MSVAERVAPTIDANRTIKDELVSALTRQGRRRRISVTDLVNPRQAFYQRAHPEIQPDTERKQAMLAGTGFHEVFGRAVSTEEFVEQFVEFRGVVGKIDIYEQVPVELKTTASLPPGPAAARRSYIDQLGMYCAMTGQDAGRLFVYKRALYGCAGALRAFDVRFRDLPAIEREMLRRRDLFREALATGDLSKPAPRPVPCPPASPRGWRMCARSARGAPAARHPDSRSSCRATRRNVIAIAGRTWPVP